MGHERPEGSDTGKRTSLDKEEIKDKTFSTKRQWKTGIATFAQNTSLHGVQFMYSKVGWTRKCLWFLLVMLCSSYLSVQVVERVLQYYQYPVTVNVKINFNKTLAFPALTICNHNAFRATAAVDSGMYELIEDLFASSTTNTSIKRAARSHYGGGENQTNASLLRGIDVRQLYTRTSHSKEDLIVECKWQGTHCGPDNFTQVITDHGVCYTFNHDRDNPLWISSAGSEHGIKLILNAEQYEYMPGPHDAAGIKLLLHDGKEFPSVANLGLSIPTGAHAYIGMQLIRVENLPEPHGACSSESSPYYKTYSHDACQLACFTEFMATECGCRDMYMPHLAEHPPVCSLKQYIQCFKENEAKLHRKVEEDCMCPVPCTFQLYDSAISLSSTSEYALERLLATAVTDDLQNKYLKARETTSRMNPIKLNQFLKLESKARSSFQQLENVMTSLRFSHIAAQKEALDNIYADIKATWDRKLYLLEWQEYHVVKNFIRARQAMEERSLFSALLGFQELAYHVEIRIHQMVHPPSNLTLNGDLRLNLYLETMNLLNGRLELCDKAIRNYTQLYYAYRKGRKIFNYQFREESKEDNDYITPKKLLIDSLDRNALTRKYSRLVDNNLRDVQYFLRMYSDLANDSYVNNTVNDTSIHYVNVQFFNRARRFYQSRDVFYKDSIEYPARVLKSKIDDFKRRWISFDTDYVYLISLYDTILENFDKLNISILHRLKQGMDSADQYVNFGNVLKRRVAQDLTSDEVRLGLNDLKKFFIELRSRGQDIYDGWSALLRSTIDIWEVILQDDNMHDFYKYRNMTEWFRTIEDVSSEYEANFTGIRDEHDPRAIVRNVDTAFVNDVNSLMDHLTEYLQTIRMNTHFIKDNFIQLDVFYREKSYEQITQQDGYDIFALICDIGGSMGLFMGASVLTLYEILELILHVIILPPFYRLSKSLLGEK